VAEKIRISGGGRANFTNRDLDVRAPQRHFVGENPQFCRSALSRYTPADFTALLQRHGVPFHEKHLGQLFCDRSATDLIDVLLRECDAGARGGRVTRWQPCGVKNVAFSGPGAQGTELSCYTLDTDHGTVTTPRLVVATGGLSVPQVGATDWGHRLARQFGLPLVPTRPALVPLTFDPGSWQAFAGLAGLALPARLSVGEGKAATAFREDMLFTHRGLSGPGILQISSYWREGQPLHLDLSPDAPLLPALTAAKRGSRKHLANELARLLPTRLADAWCQPERCGLSADLLARPMADLPDKALASLSQQLHRWSLTPNGTEGYRKAEVTAGGVDTRALSQQTMEAKTQPGLYFIGEVVDVTGWLGGYNFQWAWSSAHACAMAMSQHA
jgi:predicted Rossmann fold flavoprotein